jgi:hypothetical protein
VRSLTPSAWAISTTVNPCFLKRRVFPTGEHMDIVIFLLPVHSSLVELVLAKQ